MGTQPHWCFRCVVAASMLQWLSWVVVTETIWPEKPKTFTIWLFTEKKFANFCTKELQQKQLKHALVALKVVARKSQSPWGWEKCPPGPSHYGSVIALVMLVHHATPSASLENGLPLQEKTKWAFCGMVLECSCPKLW